MSVNLSMHILSITRTIATKLFVVTNGITDHVFNPLFFLNFETSKILGSSSIYDMIQYRNVPSLCIH